MLLELHLESYAVQYKAFEEQLRTQVRKLSEALA